MDLSYYPTIQMPVSVFFFKVILRFFRNRSITPTFLKIGRCVSDALGHAVSRQQRFVIINRRSMRQLLQCVAQPRIGLLAVGFGGFNQAVQLCAGCRAFRRVAEQPILPADHEGADGAFGSIVIHGQEAFLDVTFEFAPVARQVTDRFAESVLRGHLRLGLFHPAFQLCQQRYALFVTTGLAGFIAPRVQISLYTVQLVDQVQRNVCTPGFPFWLHFLCLSEFAPRMCPTAQAFNARLRTQCVVTCVIVGHHVATIAIEQARRQVLRPAAGVVEKSD